jgi:hypothetical protein
VARGVTEADLAPLKAQFMTPKAFADRVAAADKVVST